MTKKKMASAVMGSSHVRDRDREGQRQKERQRTRESEHLFMIRAELAAGFSILSPGSLCNDCDFRKQL